MYAGSVTLGVVLNVLLEYGPRATAAWVNAAASSLSLAHNLIVLTWVYLAWKGIPASHRGTMTPWRAVLTFLIPVYNAYWAFAMNLALCDTLDGILESADSGKRAPRALAVVAPAAWLSLAVLGVIVFFARGWSATVEVSIRLATEALWFAYMVLCDRAREEVARLGAGGSVLGAPRLSRIQRNKGPHPVTAIAVAIIAIVGFIGCWQLSRPVARVPLSSPRGVLSH
jgi:hypothetical protein